MWFTLLALHLSIRCVLFVLCNIFIALWGYYIVAPAKPGLCRLRCSIPIFFLCGMLPSLFNFSVPTEQGMVVFVCTNYLWLTISKTVGLCLNRGQLSKSLECKSFAAFCVGILLPVNIEFAVHPIVGSGNASSQDDFRYFTDAEFSLIRCRGAVFRKEVQRLLTSLLCRIVGVILLAHLTVHFNPYPFLRSVLYSWMAYCWIGGLQDSCGCLSLLLLDLKLSPNFVHPLQAMTLSEFWSKRWNLIMQDQLKDIFYEPYIEGRWVASRRYYQRPHVSLSMRLLGIFNVFVSSGLIHAFIAMYMTRSVQVPILYVFFFAVNGMVVVLEKYLKEVLIDLDYYQPLVAKIPRFACFGYVQLVLLTTAHFLFWPDLMRSKIVDRIIDSILVFSSFETVF